MSPQERHYPLPHRALLWGGVVAIGMLWVLALWSFGANVEYGVGDLKQSGVAAPQHIGLHASGDYPSNIQRVHSRHQDQPSSLKLSDPFWKILSTEASYLPSIFFTARHNPYAYFPAICLHQLQALNAPRPPPLV